MRIVGPCRILCSAAVLSWVFAVPSLGVDDASAAGAEMRPTASALLQPLAASEPGSSETDFQAALVSAKSAPRLRPFDAVAHERDKRVARFAADSPAGTLLPDGAGLAPDASMPTNFAGLTRPTAVNNGFVFVPPDTHMAKSPNRAIEVANSAIRLFTNTGGVVGTSNLNTFFGAATANGLLFDPKVIYDRNAVNKRFYVVALQKKGDNDAIAGNNLSRIWLAVSRQTDPTSLAAAVWCRYSVEGRRDIGSASENWADYPGIGNGYDALVVSTNQFRFTSPRPFIRSNVKAFRKLTAANNAAGCPAIPYFFWDNSVGNVDAFTLQPAQAYTTPTSFAGTANPAYLVSNRATTPSGSSRLWRIRNVAGAAPTMQVVSFVNSPTTTPPDAKQPGSAVLLDTGDVRLLSAAQVGNSVSAVHTTACSFAGGSGGAESCFTYRRLAVGQSVGGSPTVGVSQTLSAFGYGADSFTFWPSVAVLSNNTALATLQVTDVLADATPVRRLSTLANVKLVGGAWYAGFAVASGTCAQTFSNRTGDYTGSVADPALTSFWSAGERSLVISGTCQWDTRIARILVP